MLTLNVIYFEQLGPGLYILVTESCVTWADPDIHKPRRGKASSSLKMIYVAYIPTMFDKHNEQVN